MHQILEKLGFRKMKMANAKVKVEPAKVEPTKATIVLEGSDVETFREIIDIASRGSPSTAITVLSTKLKKLV